METVNKYYLLYAEDDMDDFENLQEALLQLSDKCELVNAKNGNELISKLTNSFSKAFPDLIILDLNMPVMDGKAILSWLKQEDLYKNIPVIVFTTSSREDDIKLCQSHKCTFFRKPTLYRDLLHVAQIMLDICVSHSPLSKK